MRSRNIVATKWTGTELASVVAGWRLLLWEWLKASVCTIYKWNVELCETLSYANDYVDSIKSVVGEITKLSVHPYNCNAYISKFARFFTLSINQSWRFGVKHSKISSALGKRSKLTKVTQSYNGILKNACSKFPSACFVAKRSITELSKHGCNRNFAKLSRLKNLCKLSTTSTVSHDQSLKKTPKKSSQKAQSYLVIKQVF